MTWRYGATLLQTPAIVFCDVDGLTPVRGTMAPGFDEFSAELDHAAIPMVWVTTRSRLQIDDPRRKLGHNHPFIAEGGCGVYLPEGYFHLRPPKSVRLGRFRCLPVAAPQPAAAEALEVLCAETGVAVVPLRSLPPRELAQNTGLPAQHAELIRHRDFDELFFFAGAAEADVRRFVEEGANRHQQLRQRGVLWSLAVGANLGRSRLEQTSNSACASFPSCTPGLCARDQRLWELPGRTAPQNFSRLAIEAFCSWIARTWGKTPIPQGNARQRDFEKLSLVRRMGGSGSLRPSGVSPKRHRKKCTVESPVLHRSSGRDKFALSR